MESDIYMYGWSLFMVFNVTFNNIKLYRGGQFYWWRKPEYVYSARLVKQHSAGRHVDPLGHIILIPSKIICVLTP
jgi:hypothetical protein